MLKVLVANPDIKENSNCCKILSTDRELKLLSTDSGLKTLELYNQTNPDVLILDSNFNDINYTEIIDKLSTSFYEKKKCNIIVTRNNKKYTIPLSNVVKVRNILNKPLNFEKLLEIIGELKSIYQIPPITETDLDVILLDLNFSLGSYGTKYMKRAIMECYYDPTLFHSLDNIYSIIAKSNNKTVAQVKDAMRSSLSQLNKYRSYSTSNTLLQLFDNTRNITTKYFLEVLVTHLHCIKSKK